MHLPSDPYRSLRVIFIGGGTTMAGTLARHTRKSHKPHYVISGYGAKFLTFVHMRTRAEISAGEALPAILEKPKSGADRYRRMFKPVKEVAHRSGERWIAAEININSPPPACDP